MIKRSIDIYADLLEKIETGKMPELIPTGIKQLDEYIGGFFNGGLFLIGAGTGHGKTALAQQLTKNISTSGKRILFIALEMNAEQWIIRYLTTITGIGALKIMRGKLNELELNKLKEASKEIPTKVKITDNFGLDISQIINICKIEKIETDIVIIDYLGLVQLPAESKISNKVAEVTKITRDIKVLTNELKKPVVLLSQLNREGQKENLPEKWHLRDSGSAENDADAIILIKQFKEFGKEYKAPFEDFDEGKEKIIKVPSIFRVVKNRYGADGDFCQWFNTKTTEFDNMNQEMQKHYIELFNDDGKDGK